MPSVVLAGLRGGGVVPQQYGIDLPQSLKEYRDRNKQRDSVQQAMKAEGLG